MATTEKASAPLSGGEQSPSPGRLTGQTAIVTGGGRGFGRAIALGLAGGGASVTVTSRTISELQATVEMIQTRGGQAIAVAGAVTCKDDVKAVIDATEDRFGNVTLLVNDAGVAGPFGPVYAVDPEDWWNAQAVHLRGPFLYANALLPGMITRRQGRIINVVSLAGMKIIPNLSGYSIAKASMIRFTEHVALECRDFGVAVFGIQPGTAITSMAEHTMASGDAQRWVPQFVELLKEYQAKQNTEEVFATCGELCVDLASGRYDALTGMYLTPDTDRDKLLRETLPSACSIAYLSTSAR